MERILIYIKHKLGFLWKLVEWGNGKLFLILYQPKIGQIVPGVLKEFAPGPYHYKILEESDIILLHDLVSSQQPYDLEYFHPHAFDSVALLRQLKKPSFLMMGAFHGNRLVGYFFLRFFANRRCFVGRFIDSEYRGKGIGKVMNEIMYRTAWKMNFRCFSTISRHNIAVQRAHGQNPYMVVLKELQNDYQLVEFRKTGHAAQTDI